MIHYNNLKVYVLGSFALLMGNIYGQEVNIDNVPTLLKKNAVYGTVGSLGLGFTHYSVNVERTLWDTNGIITNMRVRLGGGQWTEVSWGDEPQEDLHFIGSLNVLTGYRTFHLELGLGASYIRHIDYGDSIVSPNVILGIRLQKPGGNVIFRFGGGFPEEVYLSLGVAF
ncbi:MAG: hypothetical protein AAF934_11575 [Bacteroidota bacterium]